MDEVKVSIITVCFNSATTIKQTIESVMNQTYKNIEYIIIDGGSTDGTIDIIKEYKHRIAYWISEPDHGLYDAMNKGIKKATGDVIGIINSDDWYERDAVEKVCGSFCHKNIDLVYGDMTVVSGNGSTLYKASSNAAPNDLYYHMIYHHPTVFIRAAIYDKYGGFDCKYKLVADYALLLRLYVAGIRFYHLPENVAYFRLGGLSNTKRVWRVVQEERKIALDNLEKLSSLDKNKYLSLINQYYQGEKRRAVKLFAEKRLAEKCVISILQKKLANKDAYVIFGAGFAGVECYSWLIEKDFQVKFFVDNSLEKQNQRIENVLIMSPEMLKAEKKHIMVLIAVTNYQEEIKNQLIGLGLQPQADFICMSDLYDEIIKKYLKKEKHQCNKCLIEGTY